MARPSSRPARTAASARSSSRCGEVFDLKDQAPAKIAAAPTTPAVPQKSAAEIDRERREAIQAQSVRIDDELAELKKRMGR